MPKRRWRLLVGLVASAALVYGCGQELSEQKLARFTGSEPNAATASGGSLATTKTPDTAKSTDALESLAAGNPDRYLIKNATIMLETPNVKRVIDQLKQSAIAAKGYVTNSNETIDALGGMSVTLQLRIPSTNFDATVQQIGSLGKVLSNQTTAEDVTEEFVDKQARARNLKATEERLLEHLRKTGKLSDTLLVEKELTRVREDSEELEGRLKFLANRIVYSTINITVTEAAKGQSVLPPESYSSGKVVSEATRSLVSFARDIWSNVIWVGVWMPVWGPFAIVGLFYYRRVRNTRRAIRKALEEQAKERSAGQ